MMGSGKSSVGKSLAESLNWTFYDIDHELEKDHNLSINDMFAHGETQFRNHESKKLQEIASKENIVCSTGGGVVLSESNCDILSESFCVYLHASIEILCHRLENDSSRPLLSNGDRQKVLENIFVDRESKYESLSSMKIITDNSSIDEVCQEIKEHI